MQKLQACLASDSNQNDDSKIQDSKQIKKQIIHKMKIQENFVVY